MKQRPRFWGDAESGVVVPQCDRASKRRHPRVCAASAKPDLLRHPNPRRSEAEPGVILLHLCGLKRVSATQNGKRSFMERARPFGAGMAWGVFLRGSFGKMAGFSIFGGCNSSGVGSQ